MTAMPAPFPFRAYQLAATAHSAGWRAANGERSHEPGPDQPASIRSTRSGPRTVNTHPFEHPEPLGEHGRRDLRQAPADLVEGLTADEDVPDDERAHRVAMMSAARAAAPEPP
jgi:hypothetical protein